MNTGYDMLCLYNYLEKFCRFHITLRAILSKIHTWYAQFQYELNL